MAQINSFETASQRLAYRTPQLRLYGDVRSLTEGGSGGLNETGTGMNGNPPGCGTNNAKDCPLI